MEYFIQSGQPSEPLIWGWFIEPVYDDFWGLLVL